MANENEAITLRAIVNNFEYFSNWVTAIFVAGNFSVLVSLKDKLTGVAIAISFWAAVSLALFGYPILLQYGYASLSFALVYGAVCGIAGMLILSTLIGVILRIYKRRDEIGDELMRKGGLPPSHKNEEG